MLIENKLADEPRDILGVSERLELFKAEYFLKIVILVRK
jgi:hypothetical protein